jgi:hypothetical protein
MNADQTIKKFFAERKYILIDIRDSSIITKDNPTGQAIVDVQTNKLTLLAQIQVLSGVLNGTIQTYSKLVTDEEKNNNSNHLKKEN